jgi:hypothetical protein
MKDYQKQYKRRLNIYPLVIRTGKSFSKNQPILRPAVTRMLETEYQPPLGYEIERGGSIVIAKKLIKEWVVAKQQADEAKQNEMEAKNSEQVAVKEVGDVDDEDFNFNAISLFPPPQGHAVPHISNTNLYTKNGTNNNNKRKKKKNRKDLKQENKRKNWKDKDWKKRNW